MVYQFVDERLDVQVEQGAVGGPSFLTTVMQLASGKEKRNVEWSMQRLEWDLSYGIQTPEQLLDVESMFYICFGRATGFRFQDWSDFQLPTAEAVQTPSGAVAQSIGTGNGSNTLFQIYKTYTIGSYSYNRTILRPQQNFTVGGITQNWLVYVAGVLKTETSDYTINYDTGLITFVSAPANTANVAVIGQFDVPVRFNTDAFKKKMTWTGATQLPAINIIELKDE